MSAQCTLIVAVSINEYARNDDESTQVRNKLLHRKIIIAVVMSNWTQWCDHCSDEDGHHRRVTKNVVS